MGLFSLITGNATHTSAEEIEQKLAPVLVPDERIELGFKLVRDLIVLTDRRLIFVDKQGVTGKKVEYHTIPYKSITHFIVETAGRFDLDAELKIWVSGASEPMQKTLGRGVDIVMLQKLLAAAVCY